MCQARISISITGLTQTSLSEARARANLRKAETRLKRAQTLHKKWKKTVAYYDKKAAAE